MLFSDKLLAELGQFVLGWQKRCAMGTPNFEQFERELHALVLAVERECVEAELARYGLDAGEYETFELSGLDLADSPAQGCLQVTEGVAEARVAALGA